MSSIEVGGLMAMAFLMGHFGTYALAAHQITRQYYMFALVLMFAIGQAATVRVGFFVGEQKQENLPWMVEKVKK